MNLDKKFFDKWRALFPWDKDLIAKIENSSNPKEGTADFLKKKIKLLKKMASTARTRAAISALREQKRKILAPENPWYKKPAELLQSAGEFITRHKIVDRIFDKLLDPVCEATIGTKLPEPVKDGAKWVIRFSLNYALVKPVKIVSKWTKDTIVEAVDVVKESLEESRENGDANIKTAWNAAKEVGTFIAGKTQDAIVAIAEKTADLSIKMLETAKDWTTKTWKKAKDILKR